MIAYVRGELAEITKDAAVIDVGGVGFLVLMPARHLGQLPPIGSEVKIHTYMHVKEDDQQLFGFLAREDLFIFKKLIGVSGIGPKGALGILSQFSASELHLAVISSDSKAIATTPGIGKKTAEKIVLELRDQFGNEEIMEALGFASDLGDHSPGLGESGPAADSAVSAGASGTAANEAVQALVALGYSRSDALRAVRAALETAAADGDDEIAVENLIRAALSMMI